ncbi:MAG: 4'-phosphopantetheinyl transferase superfamily protein [Bacteroidia bacterium]
MSKFYHLWQGGIPENKIEAKQIHIWRASLDLSELKIRDLLKTLSLEERERASRFHFEKDRKRFISGRGSLRQILALYLGKQAQDIEFAYTANGKPLIQTSLGAEALKFNLSHSGEWMLLAISMDREIGIDIEHIRHNIEVQEIAQRFFSPAEIRSLEQLHGIEQVERFYRYWTRKEAFIKAIGMGISFPLEQVDVFQQSGKLWSPVQIVGNRDNPAWYSKDIFLAQDYMAAIVVEGDDCELSYREFH